MAEPFIGEVRIMAFDYAPLDWAKCDGQLIPVQQNPALYSLIGSTYGGDGINTFGLPDLRGRAIFHYGSGYYPAQRGGAEDAYLTGYMVGAHSHAFHCTATNANYNLPKNRLFANASAPVYSTNLAGAATLNAESLDYSGNGAPHNNMQPTLVMNFCMALDGYYPQRS